MLLSAAYSIIDLGPSTVPRAINDAGQVVGKSLLNVENTYHAFLYDSGVVTDLGERLSAMGNTEAMSVNDAGHVVGTLATPESGTQTAFFYNGSNFVTYGLPGGDYTVFNAINNTDQIVGTQASGGGGGFAFISNAGATPKTLNSIAPAIGEGSTANGINNLGQIVGEYFLPSPQPLASTDRGYFLDGTSFTDLDGPAFAISQNGQVAGWHGVRTATTYSEIAYLYNAGRYTDLGTLDGMSTYPTGVNNSGQVVGRAGSRTAFLYSGGVMMDLNTLIAPGSGWVLTDAIAINNKGLIVGVGDLNGISHGFVLTSANLDLEITHTTPVPGVARPGDVIHYAVTGSVAPSVAQTITLSDAIPAGTTLVPGHITGGGDLQGGSIQWQVGSAAQLSVGFDVRVNAPSALPPDLHEITDTAAGEAVLADGTVLDESATDTIPLRTDPLVVSARTVHGFAKFSLPPSQQTVATFIVDDPSLGAGSFSARVNWGDGKATRAAITADPAGGFDVVADHKYAKPDEYTTTVTVKGPGGRAGTASGTARIQVPLQVNSTDSDSVADVTQHTGWTGGTLPNGDLEVTLWSSIQQANQDGGGKITFDIDPDQNGGSATIRPPDVQRIPPEVSAFPVITAPVTIDGSGQAGGMVEIDGTATRVVLIQDPSNPTMAYTFVDGLTFTGGNSTVKGLAVWGFSGWGLVFRGGGGSRISGDHFGTDAAAVVSLGDGTESSELGPSNNFGGIFGGGLLLDNSARNTVGPGNVISGNYGWKYISNDPSTLSPAGVGLTIQGAAASGNVVVGNSIGPGPGGLLGNGARGIVISDAPNNTVGGQHASDGNTIAGDAAGRDVEMIGGGASGNVVQNNNIGFIPGSSSPPPYAIIGVAVDGDAHANTIGGASRKARLGNTIMGQDRGVYLSGDGNVVQGNTIGPCGSAGVFILGGHNLIGGTTKGVGNQIFSNGPTGGGGTGSGGVVVAPGDTYVGNQILGNSIHDNTLLGIDLGNDGVTPNSDSLLSRSGANDLRNAPVLTGLSGPASKLTVMGKLDSVPGKTYRIEFFASAAGNPSGFGEGQRFLGFINVKLGVGGVETFRATFAVPANLPVITATATDSDGNTSEFSNWLA